jgi:hypothetical protein
MQRLTARLIPMAAVLMTLCAAGTFLCSGPRRCKRKGGTCR